MRATAVLPALLLLLPAIAAAQVQSRPTDPPVVTAASERWFVAGEPLQFGGDVYYRAGATVFFDGNRMVRVGHYNGVPLYADTTLEPFSLVLVPVTRGLLQPYERPRRGELAGTTGSRPPAFPVDVVPQTGPAIAAAPSPPTALPLPIGAVSAYTAEPPAAAEPPPVEVPIAAEPLDARPPGVSLLRPESNDGIWIRFQDRRWTAAGPAVALSPDGFMVAGEYAGFPVFRRRGSADEVIYLPTRADLVAPYRPLP